MNLKKINNKYNLVLSYKDIAPLLPLEMTLAREDLPKNVFGRCCYSINNDTGILSAKDTIDDKDRIWVYIPELRRWQDSLDLDLPS